MCDRKTHSGRNTSKYQEGCKKSLKSNKLPLQTQAHSRDENRDEAEKCFNEPLNNVLEKSLCEGPSSSSPRQSLPRTIQGFCRGNFRKQPVAQRRHTRDSVTDTTALSLSSLTRPLTLNSGHFRPHHSYDVHPGSTRQKQSSYISLSEIRTLETELYSTENIMTENLKANVFEKFVIMRINHAEQSSKTSLTLRVRDDYENYIKNLMDCLRSNLCVDELTWQLSRSIAASLAADDLRVFVVQLEPQELVFALLEFKEKSMQRVLIKKESVPVIWDLALGQQPIRDTSENGINVFYFPYVSTVTNYRVVLEMTRRNGIFLETDERVASHIVIWGEATLGFMLSYEEQMKKQHLNQFILNVVEEIFQDVGAIETIVRKIMHFAQKLVSADRSSLFLVDSNKQELYATVFDVRVDEIDDASGKPDPQQIRFPIGTGIAGHVALTGKSLNIADAYKDNRFNKDIDITTGYRTRTILCMPVLNKDTVIGVIQMVNKRNGELFTEGDMGSFKMMAVYCGLALHNAKLYSQIERSEKKYKVALDVLSYHNSCSEAEVTKALKEMAVFKADLVGFSINPFHFDDYNKVLCAVKMFTDLFDMADFEYNTLVRFTFTVKKNYRKLPYHNWTHGFAVANSAYNIKKLALFIGCLCHDLDHRGKSNQFMKETKSPLASIYSTSTMEHHHFNQAVMILQQDGHNIFENLSKSDYKELLGLLRSSILATDIEQFFKNKTAIAVVMDQDEFSFSDQSHRLLALSIIMTAADLSACTKPWLIQAETVCGVNEEFYLQGDAERAAGRQPIPMMDRTRPEELPSGQVQFMSNISLPCYRILLRLLPDTEELFSGCQQNLEQWARIRQDIRKVVENDNSMEVEQVANALADMVFNTRGGGQKKKRLLRCFSIVPTKP